MLVPWFFALAVFAGPVTCRSFDALPKIVGGEPTTVDVHPSIVQIDIQNVWTGAWNQGCGGTILTARTVLSAAHCFVPPLYRPRFRRVRAGATYRHQGGSIAYVEDAFKHPSYGQNGFDGDIVVVRLIERLVYSSVIQQAAIPPQDSFIPDNLPVVHAGWGSTVLDGPPSEVLQHVQVYTINNDLCRERYDALPEDAPVTKNMICVGILDVGGKDACHGDSGGPLYYGNITIGVVSWGRGCAHATYPGVSTAVAPYVDWIIDHSI
nr:trypsin, alkaline C-like [Maniola hyperantus]